LGLAQTANVEGAVAAYRRCELGGSDLLKKSAKRRIRTQAGTEAQRRAFNGDCAGARRVVQSASSIGAGDLAAANVAKTQCGAP
jgi:hypothetical protein